MCTSTNTKPLPGSNNRVSKDKPLDTNSLQYAERLPITHQKIAHRTLGVLASKSEKRVPISRMAAPVRFVRDGRFFDEFLDRMTTPFYLKMKVIDERKYDE